MKRVIIFLVIFLVLLKQVFWDLYFSEILPNTVDDTNLEYIELFNNSNEILFLSWYTLKDKSSKEYIFDETYFLYPYEKKKYFRNQTKIILNNTDEELFLYDNYWNLIDNYTYSSSNKWDIIIIDSWDWVLEVIDIWILIQEDQEEWILEMNDFIDTIKLELDEVVETWTWIQQFLTWWLVWWNEEELVWWNEELDNIILGLNELIEKSIWEVTEISEVTENWTWIINEVFDTLTWSIDYKINIWTWIIYEKQEIGDLSTYEKNYTWTWIIQEIEETWTWIININLPEIKYSFQTPTYLLEKEDNETKIYNCDRSREQCKINLDLRNTFFWEYSESNYECNINFWFETWEEKKCNPNTIVVPIWIFDINIKIISRNNLLNFIETNFKIINEWYIEQNNIVNWTDFYVNNNIINITKPNIIIQSWIDENNKCKNLYNCSINLLYEQKNSKEKCLWNFWEWIYESWTEQECNPWYVKYWTWEFIINLKVYQDWNISNYSINELKFNNILEKNIEIIEKIESNTWENLVEEKKVYEKINEIEEKKEIYYDYNKLKIWDLLANPNWSDDFEYIEIYNSWDEKIDLYWCNLDDIINWWSKVYDFLENEFIEKKETKRFYKNQTKINLNNSWDEVNLFCKSKLIDSLAWDYKVDSWEILNHHKLDKLIWKAKVLKIIDIDTIKLEFLNSKKIKYLKFIWLKFPIINEYNNNDIKNITEETIDYISDNILWEEVEIEFDRENYKNTILEFKWILYINWINFNEKLIEKWYAQYDNIEEFKYEKIYKKAEKIAKDSNLWVWAFNIDNKNNEKNTIEKNIYNNNLKAIITIQWTIWKNKTINWNSITCIDTCSVNFDWRESIWSIQKYIWDFWNWQKYEWDNPKNIKYEEFWEYKVYLIVLWKNWESHIWEYFVNFYQTSKKESISSTSKNDLEKKENNENNETILAYNEYTQENNKDLFIYYLFIGIFWLVLIVLLLWKEKLL